jgi:hypothetical protein
MNSKHTGVLTVGLFILITVIFFFGWIGLLISVWSVFKIAGISSNLAVLIEALSTALATAAVFGAGFIAYQQLRETSKTRYMEVADRLFVELNSEKNIEARRIVYQQLTDGNAKSKEKLNEQEKEAIKTVLNSLDRVAFLTQSGWIPDDLVMPWMHPMIAKSWEKLEPYVLHERKLRNEPYYYRLAFELAERCKVWRNKHLVASKIKWDKKAL